MSKEIKRNLVIVIIIAVVIGGYAFFFLSPRIFRESKENLLNTEFGKEVKAGSGFSVTVEDWQYCKAEQSMAVIFSFKNTNNNPSEKIEYAAVSRNGARETKSVPCKVIYQSPTMATLTLDAVPKDFNELAIRVRFVNNHASEGSTLAFSTEFSESEFKEAIPLRTLSSILSAPETAAAASAPVKRIMVALARSLLTAVQLPRLEEQTTAPVSAVSWALSRSPAAL